MPLIKLFKEYCVENGGTYSHLAKEYGDNPGGRERSGLDPGVGLDSLLNLWIIFTQI